MYCILKASPGSVVRQEHVHVNLEEAHIKWIVFPHFARELLTNPISNFWIPLFVQPSELLHLPHDPLLLTLFRKNPPQANIVRDSPESEVWKEENPCERDRENEEKDDLKTKQSQIKDINVWFGVSGMK